MTALDLPKIPRTMLYQLEGRGLKVTVDAAWTRAEVAMRLADLAADLLADVQAEATKEHDEAKFIRAEAARGAAMFAARTSHDVGLNGTGFHVGEDPQPLVGAQVKSPVELACDHPGCGAGPEDACRDQRPGRGLRPMKSFHPERSEAFRKIS